MTEVAMSDNLESSGSYSGAEDDILIPTDRQKDDGKTTRSDYTNKLGFSIFAAVLGMFNFGYNTGVINAPGDIIQAFYNQSHEERHGSELNPNTLNILWSFTVAVFAVGGMVGGLSGAAFADKLGRKKGMLVNTVFGLVAAALFGFSKMANSYEMIIIGRFFVVLNCGLYTVLTPTYNSEIAPFSIRGAVGTVNQLAVTLGILISQVLGLNQILGTERFWPLLLALCAFGPLLQLLTLPFCPESPRFLLLNQQKEAEAVKALRTLRGRHDVQDEIDEMYSEQEAQKAEAKIDMCKLCSVKSLRLPLGVAIMMHLSQQLSGINCIFYYSTPLFISIGISADNAKYATLGVGGIMVVMTLITIPLMDRAGRRTLHLTGLGGMLFMSAVFTVTFTYALRTTYQWLQIFSVVAALVIVVFFALGPGSIPWMIVPEFFSQGPRPGAVSVGVLINWLANFAVGLSFPPMQEALQNLVFLPYTGFLLLFFILLIIYLPETKGKSFEEVAEIFAKRSGISTMKPTTHENVNSYGAVSGGESYLGQAPDLFDSNNGNAHYRNNDIRPTAYSGSGDTHF